MVGQMHDGVVMVPYLTPLTVGRDKIAVCWDSRSRGDNSVAVRARLDSGSQLGVADALDACLHLLKVPLSLPLIGGRAVRSKTLIHKDSGCRVVGEAIDE